ncbi:hypothetical protein LZ554_003620 [Drepanopeziza brunnea f. sp. 'monogermtubi']|nr:hypothetical protein LZ554_003620 [Drepanopeziza brunnea f. sp. 'monogermtubi']
MSEDCIDTPLTITANVISLLTFVLGILASYLTFYTLTRSALGEIEALKLDVDSTRVQLHSVLECCSNEACLGPVRIHDPHGTLGKSVEALENMLESLSRDLERLQQEHEAKGVCWWGREEVWKRLRWVRKREQLSGRMARIRALKMEVYVGQMSLLLRKMAAQEHGVYTQYERVFSQGNIEQI